MTELFYLQDSRDYVGNDVLWWAEKGGYTTDLSKAEVFAREKAIAKHNRRETDIPWPKEYVDARTRPAVDMQYVDIKEALQGTGIELIKPQKVKREQCRCYHCGVFLTEADYYSASGCKNCGGDNRP